MKGLGYYEAAAQIIPIFLFAIGFLSREYGTAALWKYMWKSLRVGFIAIFVFVSIAEWRALKCTAYGRPGSF